MIVTVIGAFIVERFFGFAAIGSTIIAWFVYDYSRKTLGTFYGIIVDFTVGLATYGLVAFGLMSILK